MFGVTRMSGVRGSPVGGRPGLLKSCVIPAPQKISPIPAILPVEGDCSSSMVTTSSAVHLLFSQSIETSSSVGPMPVGLDGDSDSGKQPLLSAIIAGEVVMGSPGTVDMPK